jgi:hypothetical protein
MMSKAKVSRRTLLGMISAMAAAPPSESAAAAPLTLLSAPLEVGGEWSGSAPNDARAVILRARAACLADIRLLSDRQPTKLRVDDHTSGPPHIWLHKAQPDTAWIVVDIGANQWPRLAYQFGHELGHVLCNSWAWGDNPKPPSQWLEEAMVEAFSIRGLAILAGAWSRDPPFPHNEAFADAIRQYRDNLLDGYRKAAAAAADLAAWVRAGRPPLDQSIKAAEGPGVASMLDELEKDKRCVEDMGALNRWPERSGLALEDYLEAWQTSCAEVNAPGIMPDRVKNILGLK